MTNQRTQFNESVHKCWQVAHILEVMARSRLEEMDGIDISVALEDVHNLLINALTDIDSLDFNQEEAFKPNNAAKLKRIEQQGLATGGNND